eukprot:4065847-Heterocapsa_arctica.AAC.1
MATGRALVARLATAQAGRAFACVYDQFSIGLRESARGLSIGAAGYALTFMAFVVLLFALALVLSSSTWRTSGSRA